MKYFLYVFTPFLLVLLYVTKVKNVHYINTVFFQFVFSFFIFLMFISPANTFNLLIFC